MRKLLHGGVVAPAILLASAMGATPARGETWISAYDPALHVRPPLARYPDGTRELRLDADWAVWVARHRAARAGDELRAAEPAPAEPTPRAAAGDVVRMAEVLVLEATEEMVETDGQRFAVASHQAIARRVLQTVGDHFHTIVLWPTFADAQTDALAYALNVRNDVQGLGATMPVRDLGGAYGSSGTLRTIVNMKEIGLRTVGTARAVWTSALETWGQESGHRFMMFLRVRIPNQPGDLLLGRDCAHFQRFVHTQASVQDGFSWRDNGDGTFTVLEFAKRYGDLDLYGMGLMPADEVPPSFAIVDIPGYTPLPCDRYGTQQVPTARTIQGRRLPVTIDDVLAANGPRVPARDSGYQREVNVVLTRLGESARSSNAVALAERIEVARQHWEEWAREASRNRLVVCTRTSGDCGDPRSDVAGVEPSADAGVPTRGPVAFDVRVENRGTRAATGVTTWVTVRAGQQEFVSEGRRPVGSGSLGPGQSAVERVQVAVPGVACGTEVEVTARTQSDFHYDRRRTNALLGTEVKLADDFERDSGWVVNAEGGDTSQGAAWQRGTPVATTLAGQRVAPDGAYRGASAWVTGIEPGSFVRGGFTTLVSPPLAVAGLRAPALRYALWFAGVRADAVGTRVEPSAESVLNVSARALAAGSTPGAVTPSSDWTTIDEVRGGIWEDWTLRTGRLPQELLATGLVQLRFAAADLNERAGGVEAAIDDVRIVANSPACDGGGGAGGAAGGGVAGAGGDATRPPADAGCGCRIGARGGATESVPGVALLLACFLASRVARRLTRRSRRSA